MLALRVLIGCWGLWALSACGASRAAESPGTKEGGLPDDGTLSDSVELPEVAMPEHIAATFRIRTTADDLRQLARFGIGYEAQLVDGPHVFLVEAVGSELAGAVDVTGLDAVTGPPHEPATATPLTVVFTPRNVEDLRYGLPRKPQRVGRGRWSLGATFSEGALRVCELWHVAPPIGYRILCGNSAARIAADAPYLLGTVARRARSQGLQITFSVGPGSWFRNRVLGKQMARLSADPDPASRAGSEAMMHLMFSGFAAANTMDVLLSWGQSGIEGAVEVAFRPSAAAPTNMAEWLIEGQRRGLPAAFWQLPSDSALAAGIAGFGGSGSAAPRAAFGQQMRAAFGDVPLPAETLDEILGALGALLPDGGRMVYASGGGWALVGVEEPAGYLDALHRLTALTKRLLGVGRASGPRIGLRLVADGAARMPKGSQHFVYSRDSSTPGSSGTADIHLFAVPAGGQLWVAIGRDEARVRERARAQAALPADRMLGASGELRAIGGQPVALLAAVDLGGMLLLAGESEESALEPSPEARAELARLPNGGNVKVPLWTSAERTADGRWLLKTVARLSPAAIADLSAWLSESRGLP